MRSPILQSSLRLPAFLRELFKTIELPDTCQDDFSSFFHDRQAQYRRAFRHFIHLASPPKNGRPQAARAAQNIKEQPAQ
jgi:hypothetical protein